MTCKTITIDGINYVREDHNKPAVSVDGLEYVIIRTYSAGVHAGYLKKREGKEVELVKARRLWYWSGAASLSQAAKDGFSNPSKCKFPCELDSIILTEAIEVIPCTQKAQKNISEVPVWSS